MRSFLKILFLCGFAAFSISVKQKLRVEKSPLESLKIGERMPDFTLHDQLGKEYALSTLEPGKKLILINFWATWCGPCRLEMPDFEKLYTSKEKDGLLILAIDEDEERAKLDAYLKLKPVSFPILVDDGGGLSNRFGVTALPTSVLVGGDGRIRAVMEGVQPYWDYTIDTYMKQK